MTSDLFRQAAHERRTLFIAWLMVNSPTRTKAGLPAALAAVRQPTISS